MLTARNLKECLAPLTRPLTVKLRAAPPAGYLPPDRPVPQVLVVRDRAGASEERRVPLHEDLFVPRRQPEVPRNAGDRALRRGFPIRRLLGEDILDYLQADLGVSRPAIIGVENPHNLVIEIVFCRCQPNHVPPERPPRPADPSPRP